MTYLIKWKLNIASEYIKLLDRNMIILFYHENNKLQSNDILNHSSSTTQTFKLSHIISEWHKKTKQHGGSPITSCCIKPRAKLADQQIHPLTDLLCLNISKTTLDVKTRHFMFLRYKLMLWITNKNLYVLFKAFLR